ncbi:hypothetical protein MBEHAL_1453 [Halarchaeum acidiphilum MH1-52-1]|uniref:Metallo-beta-lactamase domain-containing protein n=1 Tax=Halarchaeum acidiphilum MH1-52-1 TaxID=1261545 RepID=U3AD36_9EURY|nr:MBL fold metallo-hydrolase [Halarchaeum acidiphilum]GAD52693.1 hypothetical protein MBEHAL_1453 [Halarchaeum acidiphilum MH1-52-1]
MHVIGLHNTVFEGDNTVYLLGEDGDGPLTLVDVGFDDLEIREQLAAGLADAGHAVTDVEQVLLTHYHGDHAGLAAWVQRESGATVYCHEVDAPLVESGQEAYRALRDAQEARFEAWGMPVDARTELRAVLDTETDLMAGATDVESVSDGDTVRAGDVDLRVRHLPGHTAGHVGYVRADGKALYAGDILLPKYTPNIGGADVRLNGALAAYLGSLERVAATAPDVAWPGHRDRIDDTVGRARTIADHHRERTENVLDVLRERGPATPWVVSHDLFGDLSSIHILHGPGEAHAHLEHLETHDVVAAEDGVYSLVETDPDLDPLFPNL